jgi:hypothetical protein
MIHELKIYPEFFKHIISGEKTFEIRYGDRPYHAGDQLLLMEISTTGNEFIVQQVFTGQRVLVNVVYVYSGTGLAPGYVCMGIVKVES